MGHQLDNWPLLDRPDKLPTVPSITRDHPDAQSPRRRPAPSRADMEMTRVIVEVAKPLGITESLFGQPSFAQAVKKVLGVNGRLEEPPC
jgi:hypothetical protein